MKGIENKINFIDLYKSLKYKDAIINSLCQGISNAYISDFKKMLTYVIDEKYKLFDRDEFKGCLYIDEDETLDLILPSVRRVFGKIFLSPPTLFNGVNTTPGVSQISQQLDVKRYTFFVLNFDIDEFIDYLINMFIGCKDILKDFEHIDRTSDTLTLIVDNYIAGLVQKVKDCNDIEEGIISLKKKINRENSLIEIFKND